MTIDAATRTHKGLHDSLLDVFDQSVDRLDLATALGREGALYSFDFHSRHAGVHPLEDHGSAEPTFRALLRYYLEQSPYSRKHFRELQRHDREVGENLTFRYSVFAPRTPATEGFRNAILLLHGLNEKSWRKYLPWAQRLVEETGSPVILFPIAFHMNRAPAAWANPREMMGVVKERRSLFPGLEASSFVNAALSHRVQFAPHRFLSSGLQSYYDVVDLVTALRRGEHPLFAGETQVHVLGYSMGASLAQLLTMSDPDRLFRNSRTFLFCGGSVLDQAHPVSRAIIDREAYGGLQRFLHTLARDPDAVLGHAGMPGPDHEEIDVLTSLLFTDYRRHVREQAMAAVADRTRILTLEKDAVFPPAALRQSWPTTDRPGTTLRHESLDAPISYSHEEPFPLFAEDQGAVDALFEEFISRAANHLSPATA